jgi:glycosyltransferase involved in cell wall biosynthesis
MRLLYVVHRYAPFPGGSEYYVQAMAEESLARGHEVAVLAGEHQGDYNGVTVTSDGNVLLQKWDLIIVHGGDVGVQDFVLGNATRIPNPILYMLILPSHSELTIKAMHECAYIGWSTPDDLVHIRKHGLETKGVRVRHGIKQLDSIGKPGFKAKHGISKRMFLSCGGYWPNKKMRELAELWKRADIEDAVLVTTGYDNRMDLMPEPSDTVIPLLIDDKAEVLSAISEADCYLMHSNQEGFGLVILESMLNGTPWISRHIAGAAMLKNYGKTYSRDEQLIQMLKDFDPDSFDLDTARQYVLDNHTVRSTVDDIIAVAERPINIPS